MNPKFEISPSAADGFPPFVPCKCDSGLGSGSVVRIPDPLILQPIHLGPGPVNPSSASHNVITSHSHITPPVFKHELTFALKLFSQLILHTYPPITSIITYRRWGGAQHLYVLAVPLVATFLEFYRAKQKYQNWFSHQ